MDNQQFIDKIEELRHNTYSRITNIQKEICPMTKSLYLDYRLEYWYEGYRYTLWEDDTHIYAVDELPWCYDNYLQNTTFTESLENLIKNGQVWPFLMFIDGIVIKWSQITVIRDYTYTYLKISEILPDTSIHANIVVFPIHYGLIRYGEDKDILLDSNIKGFYFDTNGYLLDIPDFSDILVRFEILDDNVYYQKIDLYKNQDTLQFTNLPDGYIPTLDNILLFDDSGKFYHEDTSNKVIDIYNSSYGLFKVINQSSNVRWAILMYNLQSNTSSSYLYSKHEDLDKKSIIKLLTESPQESSDNIWKDIIKPLITRFDFDHTIDKHYDDNIISAISYITKYDFALWKDIFIQNSKIKSLTYTGKEFISLSDKKGYVHFSRKHSELIEDVVMVFVNHKLYEYSLDISYTSNTINIPVFNMKDDDHIEIIIYTECNNNILNITIPDKDTPVYIHPEYNLEDCYLMSDVCVNPTYPLESSEDKRNQYIVDFTYQVDDKSNYNITFLEDGYYGRQLSVVPKRQFRYFRYKDLPGESKFVLPTQFNYCHDKNQYMIFINGRKIDTNEFLITIMNQNRPFDKLVLYITTVLDKDDIVDVFYIPEPIHEHYREQSITKNGILVLQDSPDKINYPKKYPLSKYTTMLFINGLKINPLDIRDIDLNTLVVNVDPYLRDDDGEYEFDSNGNAILNPARVNSTVNVTIGEYINTEDLLSKYLYADGQSVSDDWKNIITRLVEKYPDDNKGLRMIFGFLPEIQNQDGDYKENFTDLKNILYDVIIEYYLSRDNVSTGNKFVYDFERECIEPTVEPDSLSVVKEITLTSENDKFFDYDVNAQIANSSDVQSDKKFGI